MKSLLIAILHLLCATSIAVAQQAATSPTPPPVLPPGPLLNRAADFAQWTVRFKAAASEKPKPGEKAQPDQNDTVTVVTKTKPTYFVQIVDGAGRKTEQWSIDGVQVMIIPNAQYPILIAPGSKDFSGIDFSKSDFPELGWISKGNFVDIKKVGAVDCLIFRDKIKPLPGMALSEAEGPNAKVDADAAIEIKTRLPIYMRVGESVTAYTHAAPPSEALAPPANITSLIEKWRARLNTASKDPPP